jgi:hypothetical protein
MSCGCSNTTPITTTTNCGSCGYNCSNCTCSTNPIIEPDVVCSDPEPCSELFPLECVIYTGEDISCEATANTLYPNVLHYVVLENSSTTARNFVSILNNINAQLCYLFSKDYISQFLTNIQNDQTLNRLFCNIVSACNCSCTITCATVNTATYNSSTSPNTIDVNFTQVIGATIKTFTGSISGNILTITQNPGSISFAAGQKITGTNVASNTFITGPGAGSTWLLSQPSNVSSQSLTATHVTYIVSIYKFLNNNYYYLNNQSSGFIFPANSNTLATASVPVTGTGNSNATPWLVSIEATDLFASGTCKSGYYNNNSAIVVTPGTCGFGQTTPAQTLTCFNSCIPKCTSQTGPNQNCSTYWTTNSSGNLDFRFYHNISLQSNVYLPDTYTIHWYKMTSINLSGVKKYTMVNSNDYYTTPTLSVVSQFINVTTNIPATSQPSEWLLLVTANFTTNPIAIANCNTGYPVRKELGSYYTSDEIGGSNCNSFIYIIQ